MNQNPPINIAFIAIPSMLVTSLTTPYDLLFAAQEVAAGMNSQAPKLIKKILSTNKLDNPQSLVSGKSGLQLSVDDSIHTNQQFEHIFIPALWRNPRPVVKRKPELVNWLKAQYKNGATISATGSGVTFLAQAGLLDSKPATTHWHYFEQFQKDYPNVQLKRQYFVTKANRLLCAASIGALTDLTVHHIHEIYGVEVAQHIEKHFSHEIRQSFDKIAYFEEINTNHPDENILQAQSWIKNNLNQQITIADIANMFGMSLRNFIRRFRQAADMTPIQYIQHQRMKTAKDLLQKTNLSIGEIAYRVGYLDTSHFSQLFKRYSSTTPSEYRQMVRAKLFDSKQ
jgi:transcriptional regulator GlxA family with amidase domain